MANCNKCGTQLIEGTKFCDNCGAAVTAATVAPIVETQQQQQQQMPPQGQHPQNQQMPPQGQYPQGQQMPPQGQYPQGQQMPPQGQYPQGQQMPPQGQYPQGQQMPPQGQYPQGQQMPPQGQYPQGQQMPPQGQTQNNYSSHPPYSNMPQNYNNTPPMGAQQPYYAGAGTKTEGKPGGSKTLVIVGVVVALIIVAILGILFLPNAFSGADSDELGVYYASDITMMGMSFDPGELFEDGLSVELKSGNKCVLKMEGIEYNAEWTLDGTELTIKQNDDEFSGTLENNTIFMSNLMNLGLEITFVKDGSSPATMPGGSSEQDSVAQQNGSGEQGDIDSDFADVKLTNPSEFFGTVTITNYVGSNDISGVHDAYAIIDTDVNDLVYFEIYVESIYGNDVPIMSFYIELHDYTFFPIVDDDAWIFDSYLVEDDETWFVPQNFGGTIVAFYEYDYDGESFSLEYELTMVE